MIITERAIEAPRMQSVRESARRTNSLLGLDPADATPTEIVGAVDLCVYDRQVSEDPQTDDDEILIFGLGSLWGEQLVRGLGWEWAQVVFHEYGDLEAMGVLSQDRSLAIYPYHFITGCIHNRAEVTIMLSFNMLSDTSAIPTVPARSYENVMDNVHHIVPRT
jgi:hypothetical protein